MPDKRIDRRVSRTRMVLRDALMALVLEKGYDAVTVEEIAARADVSRTTFYLHYKDKEELLLESINAIVGDLVDQISQVPLAAWGPPNAALRSGKAPHEPVLLVFQHAAENAELYQVMLSGEGHSKAYIKIRGILAEAVQRLLADKINSEGLEISPSIPMEVICNYFAGSLIGIITWWLETDMPYPPERMAEMFQKLVYPGAGMVLGIILP